MIRFGSVDPSIATFSASGAYLPTATQPPGAGATTTLRHQRRSTKISLINAREGDFGSGFGLGIDRDGIFVFAFPWNFRLALDAFQTSQRVTN